MSCHFATLPPSLEVPCASVPHTAKGLASEVMQRDRGKDRPGSEPGLELAKNLLLVHAEGSLQQRVLCREDRLVYFLSAQM